MCKFLGKLEDFNSLKWMMVNVRGAWKEAPFTFSIFQAL